LGFEFKPKECVSLLKQIIMNYLERITINPDICHGKPCIRGMWWPVEVILNLLGSDMTKDEIIADHLELEKEDLDSSINFAKMLLTGKSIQELACI